MFGYLQGVAGGPELEELVKKMNLKFTSRIGKLELMSEILYDFFTFLSVTFLHITLVVCMPGFVARSYWLCFMKIFKVFMNIN